MKPSDHKTKEISGGPVPDRVGPLAYLLPGACLACAILLPLAAGERVFLLLMLPVAWVLGFHLDGRNTRRAALGVVVGWIVAYAAIFAFAGALVWVLVQFGVINPA